MYNGPNGLFIHGISFYYVYSGGSGLAQMLSQRDEQQIVADIWWQVYNLDATFGFYE